MEQATREETMRVLLCQPGWLGARHWWCQNTDYVAGAPEIAKSRLFLGSTSNEGSAWRRKGQRGLPLRGALGGHWSAWVADASE